MYPEDRVLVAYVPSPADFEIVRQQSWYRIPQRTAPKGVHAEYIAFYFGRRFGAQRWAVHYYAPRLGHELVTRRELLPDEPTHPRAHDFYYKVQLGPLQQLAEPIVSLRWRRITFLHTTWDRFQDARELNDLFIEGGEYVDRLFAVLKDRDIPVARAYTIQEKGQSYVAPLVVFTPQRQIPLWAADIPQNEADMSQLVTKILQQIAADSDPFPE